MSTPETTTKPVDERSRDAGPEGTRERELLPVSYKSSVYITHLQRDGDTNFRKVTFLKHFRRSGNVSDAARLAKVDRTAPYRWEREDPKFKKAWEIAREESIDVLEKEARRRAVTGYLEPVYFQGKKVGAVKKYSDQLLVVLLRAHHPAFKEKLEVTAKTRNPVHARIEEALAIDIDKLTPLQEDALKEVVGALLMDSEAPEVLEAPEAPEDGRKPEPE